MRHEDVDQYKTDTYKTDNDSPQLVSHKCVTILDKMFFPIKSRIQHSQAYDDTCEVQGVSKVTEEIPREARNIG